MGGVARTLEDHRRLQVRAGNQGGQGGIEKGDDALFLESEHECVRERGRRKPIIPTPLSAA
ncbi:hypothetical protein IMCC9480_2882 [Oxalobacteraceae bacterium IMCC9480]|nr:hypothetical protein IMCC9480_2882 [Oxalobacteraceae bacterium IMCC9480]